jgi:ankyrin repeat protein
MWSDDVTYVVQAFRLAQAGLKSCTTYISALVMLVAASSAAFAQSPLADRIQSGDRKAALAMIAAGTDVNKAQPDGTTALHWATYRVDRELVQTLLKKGARADVANRYGASPLAEAARVANVDLVGMLLEAGARADATNEDGQTALMLAARNGNPDAVKVLIEGGASVNARETIRGTTALMWAVEQKHPAAVKALLDGGADYKMRSAGAGIPRNYLAPRVNTAAVKQAQERYARAAANGRTYEEQLKWERENGVFTGPPTIGEQLARQQNGQQPSTTRGQQSPQAAAPAAGASAQPAPAPGATAAPGATGRGRGRGGRGGAGGAAGAERRGAGEDETDDNEVVVAGLVGSGGGGLTALVFAAREGDLESAKLLIAAGADVNQTTEYGWTPLLTATNNRHYALGEYLIEHGADVNKANKGNWTPLYLATDNRNIEGGDYPVPKPDLDHLDYIKFLLEHGADPNARAKDNTLTRTIFTMQWFYEDGCTPFVRASQSSDTELMQLLLDWGADPFIRTEFGDTALTAAGGIGWVEGVTYERSAKENFEAVKTLVYLGLDVNGANRDGRTALMGAALKGRNDVVQFLVDHGAKLDQRDNGSRDTNTASSKLAGHTWDALDYADGLVRVGVQSAVNRAETATLIRKLMTDRGMKVPPPNRVVDSICVVELCQERAAPVTNRP